MRALVVGGRNELVLRSVVPRLKRFGLEMGWHWDMDRNVKGMFDRPIPAGAEAVVVLYEMTPHAHGVGEVLRREAEVRGIPCVGVSHKLGPMTEQLERQGFKQDPSVIVAEGIEEEAPVSQPVMKSVSVRVEGSAPRRSLEEAKAELVRLLRELRDQHHVATLRFDASARTLQLELMAEITEEV